MASRGGRRGRAGRGTSLPAMTEEAARNAVNRHLDEGRLYVQLRIVEGGNFFKFYCAACGLWCDTEERLSSHFRGYAHSTAEKLVAKTLLKANPWPFDDGYRLFHGHEQLGHELEEEAGRGDDQPLAEEEEEEGTFNLYKNPKLIGFGEIVAESTDYGHGYPNRVLTLRCEWPLAMEMDRPGELEQNRFAIATFRYAGYLGMSRISEERMESKTCLICSFDIWQGKDASALFNLTTKQLACQPRPVRVRVTTDCWK